MKRTNKWLLVGSLAAVLLSLSAKSYAQDAAGGGAAAASPRGWQRRLRVQVRRRSARAGGFGPSDATIRVRPGPVRTTLIRPRTSFVPEMLKSVENI